MVLNGLTEDFKYFKNKQTSIQISWKIQIQIFSFFLFVGGWCRAAARRLHLSDDGRTGRSGFFLKNLLIMNRTSLFNIFVSSAFLNAIQYLNTVKGKSINQFCLRLWNVQKLKNLGTRFRSVLP